MARRRRARRARCRRVALRVGGPGPRARHARAQNIRRATAPNGACFFAIAPAARPSARRRFPTRRKRPARRARDPPVSPTRASDGPGRTISSSPRSRRPSSGTNATTHHSFFFEKNKFSTSRVCPVPFSRTSTGARRDPVPFADRRSVRSRALTSRVSLAHASRHSRRREFGVYAPALRGLRGGPRVFGGEGVGRHPVHLRVRRVRRPRQEEGVPRHLCAVLRGPPARGLRGVRVRALGHDHGGVYGQDPRLAALPHLREGRLLGVRRKVPGAVLVPGR